MMVILNQLNWRYQWGALAAAQVCWIIEECDVARHVSVKRVSIFVTLDRVNDFLMGRGAVLQSTKVCHLFFVHIVSNLCGSGIATWRIRVSSHSVDHANAFLVYFVWQRRPDELLNWHLFVFGKSVLHLFWYHSKAKQSLVRYPQNQWHDLVVETAICFHSPSST